MKNLNKYAFPLDTPLKKLQKAQIYYTGSSCKAVFKND